MYTGFHLSEGSLTNSFANKEITNFFIGFVELHSRLDGGKRISLYSDFIY